jgi:hypothetical protein
VELSTGLVELSTGLVELACTLKQHTIIDSCRCKPPGRYEAVMKHDVAAAARGWGGSGRALTGAGVEGNHVFGVAPSRHVMVQVMLDLPNLRGGQQGCVYVVWTTNLSLPRGPDQAGANGARLMADMQQCPMTDTGTQKSPMHDRHLGKAP